MSNNDGRKILKEKDHLGNLGVVWRKILKWMLQQLNIKLQTGFSCPRVGTKVGI
jgi:hypothetical protein